MAILPDALSAIQLADLNRQVDSLLAKIEANAAELGAEQLAANELHNGALGAKSNAGFCFGDITQRDPGKYEVRLPELEISGEHAVLWWEEADGECYVADRPGSRNTAATSRAREPAAAEACPTPRSSR